MANVQIAKQLFENIKKAVIEGDAKSAISLANEGLGYSLAPNFLLEQYTEAITRVGELWENGDYFLPELMASAEAVIAALKVLRPKISSVAGQVGKDVSNRTAIIGTVKGDIHDIGKSLVSTMLMASGFNVVDLGVNVGAEEFIRATVEYNASLVGISALLTTTMMEQHLIIEQFKKEGLRNKVKILVGGAPVNEDWAREIGADGTAPNAFAAAELAKTFLLDER